MGKFKLMAENLAYSLALDLLFNGQNMDYCERPISLTAFGKMAMFDALPERARVAVIGAGGGRLVKSLIERGYFVDAFEGRQECSDHLERYFAGTSSVKVLPMMHLNEPTRRERMNYSAVICMDDLRAFRDNAEWTEYVQRIIRPNGYFVYSQVSNQLPSKKNTLGLYFRQSGIYNVSEETAKEICASYEELNDWEPGQGEAGKGMAMETLDMIKTASSLRRNIRSGVEVSYVVWQRRKDDDSIDG